MRIARVALALLPLFATATISDLEPMIDFDDIEVTSSIPTLDQMHAAYPDITFQDIGGRLEARDANTNFTIAASTVGFRFTTGVIAAVGYFSLGPGATQILTAVDACEGASTSNHTACVIRVFAATSAHLIIGGAGIYGGREFIQLFWQQAAQQAISGGAVPRGERSYVGGSTQKRDCGLTSQSTFNSEYRFSGSYALKAAARNFCYAPSASELRNVQALADPIVKALISAPALRTDYTLFTSDASKSVLGRYRVQLGQIPTDCCPVPISGGDSCTCSGC